MPLQQVLDINAPKAVHLTQFIVSDSNRFAYERIKNDADWPVAGVFISGESGYGKTYLLECWRQRNPGALCLDNVQDWQDEALFHAYNKATQQQKKMLFTADKPPAFLPFTLPDLRSRLSAMTHVSIAAPDDVLLKQLMLQQFQQQQIQIKQEYIDHILIHAPRQPRFIMALVRLIDQSSLEQQVPITKKLIDYCILDIKNIA